MIDSVVFASHEFDIRKFDENKQCLGGSKLQELTEIHDRVQNLTRHTGYIKNLKLRFWPKYISISGSLPQYLLGNSIETLRREDVKEVITQLGHELLLDIGDFHVYRIDIGTTLLVHHPVSFYLDHILSSSRLKLSTYSDETRALYHGSRKLLFYDKYKQLRKQKSLLRESMKFGISDSRNHLRYEVQLKKRVRDQLRLPEFKARDLYDPEIYTRLVNLWREEFKKIRAKPDILDFNPLGRLKPKDFIDSLASVGIVKIGTGEILGLLRRSRDRQEIAIASYYRLLGLIRKLENRFCCKSDYWLELENDIENIANHCR